MSFGLLSFFLLIRLPVTIAAMESQIKIMLNRISALKTHGEEVEEKERFHLDSGDSLMAKVLSPAKNKSALKKVRTPDDDMRSFEQIKYIRKTIQTL